LAPDSGTQRNDIPKRGLRVRLYLEENTDEDENAEYWILTPNGTEILGISDKETRALGHNRMKWASAYTQYS